MSANWIAIGRSAGAAHAYAVSGGQVTDHVSRPNDAEALKALASDAQTILRIGDGSPDTVPCPVLPGHGRGLPVITQDQPADVLGGWARLWLAGFLARHPGWDGVVCVQDGDVTHWVHLSADEVVSCASFLTLRLIAALGGGDTPDTAAMADSQSRPERLAQYLREAEVRGNPAAITGTLIGAELAASRVYWLGQQVGLIAPEGAASAYSAALNAQGVPVTEYQPRDLIHEGLAALGRVLGA